MKKTVLTLALAFLGGTSAMAQSSIGMGNSQKESMSVSNMNNVRTNSGVEQVMSSSLSQSAKAAGPEISEMRRNALVDMASNYGNSAGLAWKLKKITNEEIKQMENKLDTLYNFSDPRLSLESGVLLPVIEEGQSNYAQNSDDEVRFSDKAFKIVAPSKIVSVYPTWRNYLSFSIPTFEEPPKAFLPQNPAEAAIWDEQVKMGWEAGVMQAMHWFQASKDRLDRDFNGMIKSRQLIAQGILTMTVVSRQNLGVTGGGRDLSINDQIFKIVDHSALVSDEKEWKVQYPITYKSGADIK